MSQLEQACSAADSAPAPAQPKDQRTPVAVEGIADVVGMIVVAVAEVRSAVAAVASSVDIAAGSLSTSPDSALVMPPNWKRPAGRACLAHRHLEGSAAVVRRAAEPNVPN